jgi:hypothetical protein
MRKTLILCPVALALIGTLVSCQKKAEGDTYAAVVQAFMDPPAEFRSAPLWVWNDRMTREQVEAQLADFQAHGIGGVFIHPRPGLITPYLSEEWLDLCRHAVEVGKGLGMKVWIYDENSYPSGFAGGHVPAEMPESVGKGLRLTKAAALPAVFDEQPIVVLKRAGAGFEDISGDALQEGSAAKLGKGDYYIFTVQKATPEAWFGGYTYVDLMDRAVTEKFLAVTLSAYRKAFGNAFGPIVPGSFQDEAHIGPVMGPGLVNFTPAMFEAFQKKWGYDLRPHLPSLYEEVGEWRMIRHNFYATTLELFIEGWAKPYYEYCAANNLWLTGHYLEHEWPGPNYASDYLAMLAYSHMPGIDCLMNQWQTGPHDQFGNARPPKEIRSVANQLGRPRTMSETYGAGGWDLTFVDQKRIADWEFALGVNFINQHLSYATIMGARKRDHPQSFSYHEPWWRAYKVMADYLARMSVVTSLGRQMNRILVLEPTTTAWMHYAPGPQPEILKAIGDGFTRFLNGLEAAQVEYDLGSEDILKNHGRAEGARMTVGERSYEVVVLPAEVENLNGPTVHLLSRYLEGGGRVIGMSEAVRFVDGKPSEEPGKLAALGPSWAAKTEEEAMADLGALCASDIGFSGLTGDRGMFFHQRRRLADAEVVFLANVSPDKAMSGTFTGKGRSAEAWDSFTGKVSPYECVTLNGKVEVAFHLPPGGSAVFCLRPRKGGRVKTPEYRWGELVPDNGLTVKMDSPNVLTVDHCDLRLGGKDEKDLYFYEAQRRAFQYHGLERNPWDNAVQYKTSVLDLDKFGPDTGFEAGFWFEAEPGVELISLRLVVERPSLYEVSMNGRKVEPLTGEWWLDKAFGVFEIGGLCQAGRNRVMLKSSPFTIHTELEPVYILGDFGLAAAEKGFRLVPPTPLALGPWSEQGRPLYARGVSYGKTYTLSAADPVKERTIIRLGAWLGSVAEVKIGAKTAGYIFRPPFELDITDSIRPGQNEVSVTVFGTLKNTLGPHHNNPPLGTAWPGMFQKGPEGNYPPGSSYSVVGYGLFEDFKLLSRTTAD